MKTKQYYLMLPLYIIIFVAVILINTVFSKGGISPVNITINVILLLIIGALMVKSCISLGRLADITGELDGFCDEAEKRFLQNDGNSIWKDFSDKDRIFRNEVLNKCFQKYQMAVLRQKKSAWRSEGEVSVSAYFNEQLLDSVGEAYFNQALPGIFTGLGILGTFIGLSFGLMSFNGNDIFTISDNVGPLLEGMKVAFHTSVYGMIFSLVFNFIYRGIQAEAYNVLNKFLETFEECVAPTRNNEGDTFSILLSYQSQMVALLRDMEEMMEGNAHIQAEALQTMMNNFTISLSQNVSGDLRNLGAALEQSLANQKVYNAGTRQLAEATATLLESCENMRMVIEKSCDRDEQVRARLMEECDRLSGEIYTLSNLQSM